MWIKVASAIAVVTAGGYTASQFIEEVLPNVVEAAAQQSFDNIVDAAYLQHLITGDDWDISLEATVASARNASALTVNRTTLRWVLEDDCFYAEVPTPDTEPKAVRCE